MKASDISLIISTYNRPDALRACLDSVRHQYELPGEVVIADDGSSASTRELIESIRKDFPIPIVHVWHEDAGFRLAKIRNRAMAQASGRYLVQIDGDIVLERHFIADHARFAKKNHYVKGVRVRLDEAAGQRYCAGVQKEIPGFLSPGLIDRHKSLRFIPLAKWFASHFKKGTAGALGCNMAFFKEDILKINGYDESFEGWGREDDDLAHRLHRSGVEMRDVRFAAICFHLWHPENSRDNVEENIRLCRERDAAGVIRAAKGIDSYL